MRTTPEEFLETRGFTNRRASWELQKDYWVFSTDSIGLVPVP